MNAPIPRILKKADFRSGLSAAGQAFFVALLKAHPPLEQAHTLLLWRDDDPAVAALLKRMATPTGARWITVHPGGSKDGKGVPVMVQETHSGSGVYHVIGGAGGKLNYLKLRGLKSEEEYKQHAAEKRKINMALEQQRRERDRKAGLETSKAQEKDAVKQQQHAAEKRYIAQVAKAAGWTEQDTAFPHEQYAHLSPRAFQAMRNQHHAALVDKAAEFIKQQKDQVLGDPERLKEALGEVPLTAPDAKTLSTNDVLAVKPSDAGAGFAADYGKRAADKTEGGKPALAQDIAEAKQAHREALPEPVQRGIIKRKETAAKLKDELKDQRPPEPPSAAPGKALETRTVLDLIKAEKELIQSNRASQKANRAIDEAKTLDEVKAYNLHAGRRPVEDAEAQQDLQDQLRTIQTRALLDAAKGVSEGQDPANALSRHIGVGAQAAADALALTVAGHGLIDRSVLDVLGMEGGARAIAQRLHQTLIAKERAELLGALEDYHVDHYTNRGQEALQEAKTWQDIAAQIEVDSAQNGLELRQAQQLNAKRIEALAHARRILGTALGEFEMNAALITALKEGPKAQPLQVALGKIGLQGGLQQARALGLRSEDYTLSAIGGTQFLSVSPDGLNRLAQPIDREKLTRQRAALAIISGQRDEEHWLPNGIAQRPDLAVQTPPGVAPSLAEPYDARKDPEQALRDYIGGRTADGDAPADIMADLLNADWINRTLPRDQRADHLARINRILPSYRERKKLTDDGEEKTVRERILPEHYQPLFQRFADEFVQSRYGEQRQPLHRQDMPLDDVAVESLHRALSAEPAGVAAYKAIGDLNHQDQAALRAFFEKHVGGSVEAHAQLRDELKALKAREPVKYIAKQDEPADDSGDMFGSMFGPAPDPEDILKQKLARLDQVPIEKRDHAWMADQLQTQRQLEDTQEAKERDRQTPEWKQWNQERQAKQQEIDRAGVTWDGYTRLMGRKRAYQAVQDLIRSHITQHVADAYNTLNPHAPLKVGRMAIRNHLDHLSAIDPDEREKQLAILRTDQAKARRRDRGKFAEGGIKAEQSARKEAEAGFQAANMGLFGDEEPAGDKPLLPHQRHTLGPIVEQRLAALMSEVGQNFKPGQPTKLWNASMSGRYIQQQRAIKLIEANNRVALQLGTGSGKTLVGLGAFTHLHAQGKAQRGLFVVPSVVQAQMHGEALRYLQPNQYRWHAQPGASREERIAALKDPDNHFVITTHQSLRDDLLHLGAQRAGINPEQLADQLDGMTPQARAGWMKNLLEQEGIDADYVMVDEAHGLLNRAGKDNSRMANVLDAVSDNAAHYVNATANMVKNDSTEIFSLLQKLDPARYTDRTEFMRRYGADTASAKAALQRELLPYTLNGRIESGGAVHRTTETVPLSAAQDRDLTALHKNVARIRLARMQGTVDIDAAKAVSPSAFANVPEDQHEAIARTLTGSIGIVKESAVQRILNAHPEGGKLDRISSLVKERAGKPGVIFAHSLKSVRHIAERLERDGHRVVTLTGKDSAETKGQKKAMFNPESGEAQADILIASDAGAVGMNAQRGQWLIQHDTPHTAMVHGQRNGRIDRLGQKNAVELIDLVHDHPAEYAARDRLAKKYELHEVMTAPQAGLDDTGLAHFLQQRRAEAETAAEEAPPTKAL